MLGKLSVGKVYGKYPSTTVCVRIDRKTILGNPYYMSNEGLRDSVCDKYHTHFKTTMLKNPAVQSELRRIYNLMLEGKDVVLQCHCAPKRCHGDTIKQCIEHYIQKSI